MHLYLDECYNTGNNWLDKSQPFFTYGGWLISPDKLSQAQSIMQSFCQNHQGELKSKSFTSHKGISQVVKLSKKLISDCNAKVCFMCLEKYYMIACKAVEVFFDHETNKSVNGYLTFPNEYEYYRIISHKVQIDVDFELIKSYLPPISVTKRGLAETIKQNEEFCICFGEILNSKSIDEDSIANIINKLKSIFIDAGFDSVAGVFEIDNFNISDICDELQVKNISVDKKFISKSILVQPCIYEMISSLKEKYTNLELIADTLGDQDTQFTEMSQLLNVPIHTVDSKIDVMIMASDLLIGQFARLIKDISIGSKDIATKDLELLKYSFTPSESPFYSNLSFWNCKFSNNIWESLRHALALNVDIIDFSNVLKEQFKIFLKQ